MRYTEGSQSTSAAPIPLLLNVHWILLLIKLLYSQIIIFFNFPFLLSTYGEGRLLFCSQSFQTGRWLIWSEKVRRQI